MNVAASFATVCGRPANAAPRWPRFYKDGTDVLIEVVASAASAGAGVLLWWEVCTSVDGGECSGGV